MVEWLKMTRKSELYIAGHGAHIIWNPYTKKGMRTWMLNDKMGSVTRW